MAVTRGGGEEEDRDGGQRGSGVWEGHVAKIGTLECLDGVVCLVSRGVSEDDGERCFTKCLGIRSQETLTTGFNMNDSMNTTIFAGTHCCVSFIISQLG